MSAAVATRCGQGHSDFMVRHGKRECRVCRNEGKRRSRQRRRVERGLSPLTFSMSEMVWERLHWRLDRSGECWLWTGCCNDEGYGQLRFQGRRLRAHRAVYEHFNGPVPEPLELDHLCGNRACCNPAHLEAVTHQENVRRSRKAQCKHGHELVPENLLAEPRYRSCRACHRERNRRWRAKSSPEAQATKGKDGKASGDNPKDGN